jgi:DNA-binding NarL/FixJ family response regulator
MPLVKNTPKTSKQPTALPEKDSPPTGPRILLADDQREILQAVAMILKEEFQVVGLAEDGNAVLQLLPSLSADVIVLDIFMPKLNGIETALRLKSSGSTVKVVFLTVNEDPDFLFAAMSTGAQGYVLKPHLATDLVPALWTVLAGRTFVSPSMLLH